MIYEILLNHCILFTYFMVKIGFYFFSCILDQHTHQRARGDTIIHPVSFFFYVYVCDYFFYFIVCVLLVLWTLGDTVYIFTLGGRELATLADRSKSVHFYRQARLSHSLEVGGAPSGLASHPRDHRLAVACPKRILLFQPSLPSSAS